jgi:hypothetical protein
LSLWVLVTGELGVLLCFFLLLLFPFFLDFGALVDGFVAGFDGFLVLFERVVVFFFGGFALRFLGVLH